MVGLDRIRLLMPLNRAFQLLLNGFLCGPIRQGRAGGIRAPRGRPRRQCEPDDGRLARGELVHPVQERLDTARRLLLEPFGLNESHLTRALALTPDDLSVLNVAAAFNQSLGRLQSAIAVRGAPEGCIFLVMDQPWYSDVVFFTCLY